MASRKLLNPKELTSSDIESLVEKAEKALDTLITPQGIFASSKHGWHGAYHAWFGRDSAITANLLIESIEFGGDKKLALRAHAALAHLAKWQGKSKIDMRGERSGKIPHEVREIDKTDKNIHETLHAARTNEKPWYIDTESNVLINWDSCDSTPLWLYTILRGNEVMHVPLSSEVEKSLSLAVGWCQRNLKKYDGFIAFTAVSKQKGRVYSGLNNQGWKDTDDIYQIGDGSRAEYPIKEALINAEAWAALKLASKYLGISEIIDDANKLKKKFNAFDDGFRVSDSNNNESYFYAEAIAGNGGKIVRMTVDLPAALWSTANDKTIFIPDAVGRIVQRSMSRELFHPAIGIRNYSLGTEFKKGTFYHGGSHTYWPFMSALSAAGMYKNGYIDEALLLSRAMLNGVKSMGSNIEMFIETEDGNLDFWSHPSITDHKSALEQAWTAAGVYYCGKMLLQHPQS